MGTDVIKNIIATCEKLGEVSLGNIKLENADASLLDITKHTLDQHVAMQPSGMAYFGFLKRVTSRRLESLESDYDHWTKRKFAEARVAVEAGTTSKTNVKVEDIKSRLLIDNEPKIKEWKDRIAVAQEAHDAVESFFEAWKQKSFTIRETVSIEEDERFTSTSMKGRSENRGGSEDMETRSLKMDKVREIMKKRRE